jgi:hypothetical protein
VDADGAGSWPGIVAGIGDVLTPHRLRSEGAGQTTDDADEQNRANHGDLD